MSTAEVFRWTTEQFELAGEAGLFGDDRAELLDGEVLEHRDPDPQLSLYRSVRSAGRGATLAVPDAELSVAVDDLLPWPGRGGGVDSGPSSLGRSLWTHEPGGRP